MTRIAPITAFRAALGTLLASFAATAAQAVLPAYAIETLVLEGDPDPVAGTLNQMIGDVDFDADGRIAFVSYVYDGVTSDTRIFGIEAGVLAALVSTGDAVPGAIGLVFSDVGRPRIAAPGVLAYLALYDDGVGDVAWSAFLRHGAAESAIAVPGTPAPGGGSIDQVVYVHSATAAPAAAFGAWVDAGGPGPIAAHFVHAPAGLRELYRDGQAAPAPVGGSFSGVQPWWVPALLADGSATFYSDVAGGSAASGFFRASPAGVVTALLLAGDPVTTPGGGTFDSFFRMVDANAAGDHVIAGYVQRPPLPFAAQAIVVLEGNAQREIAFRGDAIPGTSPARFYAQLAGSGPPELNAAGAVAFVGILTDALENDSETALLLHDGSALRVLAKAGDPVPGVPGATFSDFLQVRLGDDGRIAFYGFTSAGAGVFLATPAAAVPALPPGGFVLLALGLAAVARARGTRAR